LKYDRALGALELLVNKVLFRNDRFKEALSFRPGFRHHWDHRRVDANNVETTRISPNNTEEAFSGDPLDWCLTQIVGQPDDQTNFDHAMLFSFLHNHLSTSPRKEQARVDEILYQKLSHISAAHEMLVSVRLHRPQNQFRCTDEAVQSEDRGAWKKMRVADENMYKRA
jgi:hypothetical protein